MKNSPQRNEVFKPPIFCFSFLEDSFSFLTIIQSPLATQFIGIVIFLNELPSIERWHTSSKSLLILGSFYRFLLNLNHPNLNNRMEHYLIEISNHWPPLTNLKLLPPNIHFFDSTFRESVRFPFPLLLINRNVNSNSDKRLWENKSWRKNQYNSNNAINCLEKYYLEVFYRQIFSYFSGRHIFGR